MKALIISATNEVRYFLCDECQIETCDGGVRIVMPDGQPPLVMNELPFDDYYIVENILPETVPTSPPDFDGPTQVILYQDGQFVLGDV